VHPHGAGAFYLSESPALSPKYGMVQNWVDYTACWSVVKRFLLLPSKIRSFHNVELADRKRAERQITENDTRPLNATAGGTTVWVLKKSLCKQGITERLRSHTKKAPICARVGLEPVTCGVQTGDFPSPGFSARTGTRGQPRVNSIRKTLTDFGCRWIMPV